MLRRLPLFWERMVGEASTLCLKVAYNLYDFMEHPDDVVLIQLFG
jgi:hypothetical protein